MPSAPCRIVFLARTVRKNNVLHSLHFGTILVTISWLSPVGFVRVHGRPINPGRSKKLWFLWLAPERCHNRLWRASGGSAGSFVSKCDAWGGQNRTAMGSKIVPKCKLAKTLFFVTVLAKNTILQGADGII